MVVLALVTIAVFAVMVVIGATTLEGQNERRHPPDDDDGCRKDEDEP